MLCIMHYLRNYFVGRWNDHFILFFFSFMTYEKQNFTVLSVFITHLYK